MFFPRRLDKVGRRLVILISTAWKVSVFGLFLVLIFWHSNSYSVRMRENTDQKNSEYGHFSPSEEWVCIIWIFHETFLKDYFKPWKGFKKVNKMGRDGKKGLGCKKGERGNFGTDKLSRNLIYRKIWKFMINDYVICPQCFIPLFSMF